jgi:hypothetical protein
MSFVASALRVLVPSAASCVTLFALTSEAYAQDPAPASSTPSTTAQPPSAAASSSTSSASTPATPKEGPDGRPVDDPFRSIALTANPLSLILGRIGINVEWLPATHHAIVLNPFGQFASAGEENSLTGKTSYTNFGGELGYRFYTGSRGANGFFIGPFATILTANSTTTRTSTTGKVEASTNFLAYGGGLDLGGQHVFKNGFTIGGGAGLMYLTSSASGTNSSSTIKFEGVLPRFLLTAGYSF